MLRVPAAASQDCRALVYAVYDALYNGTRPLARLPLPVTAVAVSGDGRAAAAATAERIYVIREGRAVAEIEARMARSVALSWDGLAMAYATDSGVRVQRFRVARIEARGCPLPATARVGNITYSPPVDALVPAEAAEVFAGIVEGPRLRCVPVQNATRLGPVTVIEYRVEYRVDAPPLVRARRVLRAAGDPREGRPAARRGPPGARGLGGQRHEARRPHAVNSAGGERPDARRARLRAEVPAGGCCRRREVRGQERHAP
jgi:hypothetical protein